VSVWQVRLDGRRQVGGTPAVDSTQGPEQSVDAAARADLGDTNGAVPAGVFGLIDRLEQENRALAREVGYLQAQLEHARAALRMPEHPRARIHPPGRLSWEPLLAGLSAITRLATAVRAAPRTRELVQLAVLILVLFIATRPVVHSFRVEGLSMVPTLQNGQMLLINQVAYWRVDGTPLEGVLPTAHQGGLAFPFGGPQRGDVAVFHVPDELAGHVAEEDLVKRIIGLPGDMVLIEQGVVFVNDARLSEPYVVRPTLDSYPEDGQPTRVPEDSYFVLGDNRAASVDSRLGWLVPADSLVGRAWLSYWPPARWGLVPRGGTLEPVAVGQPNQPPVATPAEEAPPVAAPASSTPVSAPTPVVILDERFAAPYPGWPDEPQGTAWFAEGAYQLVARDPGQFVALGAPVRESVRDVVVRAIFRKVGGPPGGGYGLIVRDQGPGPRDGRNQAGWYYVLEAGDRGEVGIWRRDGDHWTDLLPWTRSDAVQRGGAPNELEARAVGDRLRLVVNGREVASVADAALVAGGVGVFVGGDGNEVALDSLQVSRPE
jgi:signal peptidase I